MNSPRKSSIGIDLVTESITTVIGVAVIYEGDIRTDEGVLVLGAVKGNVSAENGLVYIAEGATVFGAVKAKRAIIAGEILGDVVGAEDVLVAPSGHIHGDVAYTNISLMPDATVDGRLSKIKPHIARPLVAAG